VALNDLDGDGLSNDFASVDTRTDRVVVGCVPGTGERFVTFELESAPLRVDHATMAPMGCLPGDFNEDGLTDVLVYYWGRSPIVYLRRANLASGAGSLGPESYTPCEAAAGSQPWFTNAATLADIDGDGHLDVYVGNYFPDGAKILDAAARGTESMQRSMSRGVERRARITSCWARVVPSRPERWCRLSKAPPVLPEEVANGWTLAVGAATSTVTCFRSCTSAMTSAPTDCWSIARGRVRSHCRRPRAAGASRRQPPRSSGTTRSRVWVSISVT
jgi:hypothetical protein